MVLLTILLFTAWLGLEVYFALTSRPNPTTNYGALAEEHVRQLQADREGEDVWPVMIEAVHLTLDTLADLQDAETGLHWSEGEWQFESVYGYEAALSYIEGEEYIDDLSPDEAKAALEAQRRMAIAAIRSWDDAGITRRLDEIAASGKGVRPMPDTTQRMMIDMLLPELGELRTLARGVRARMALAAEEGDWETYAASMRHGLALSRIASDQVWLIERLVGNAIRALMLQQLQRDLGEGRLPIEACERVTELLNTETPRAPTTHALDGEMFMQLDAVQWTHDRRGRIILDRIRVLDGSQSTSAKVLNVASIVYPRRQATEAWFRQMNQRVNAYAALSVRERRAAQNRGESIDDFAEIGWSQPLGRVLFPAYGRYIGAEDQLRLQESGIRTMLALEQHRHEAGALPESLDALVPKWLSEVPMDPFAETPAPLIYRVLGAETGPGYTLYSVGYDATDDGGTRPPKHAVDALRSGSPGTDFILTEPLD